MQRIALPLALVLVLALSLPAPAAGATRSYSGEIDPSGELSFELKRKPGRKTIRRFAFVQVPVECAEGDKTTTGHLTFGMRVEGKEFGTRADDGEGSKLRVSGRLKQRGRRATGKLRIHGKVPTDDGTRGSDCDTGVLVWEAAR